MIAPGIQTQCLRDLALQGGAPDGHAGKRTQMEDSKWFRVLQANRAVTYAVPTKIILQSMTKA